MNADLVLGEGTDGFGHVADIEGLDSVGFLILDRREAHVVRFDAAGTPIDTIGREGPGPGELTSPYALTESAGRVVVLDHHPTKLVTVYESDGSTVYTASGSPENDWGRLRFREPFAFDEVPFQWTWEDASRRLLSLHDGAFVLHLQNDEVRAKVAGRDFPFESPPVAFVRHDEDGPGDTLFISHAPPSLPGPQYPGAYPIFAQPIYSARPIFAAGEGWIATGRGDENSLRISGPAFEQPIVVTWPDERRDIRHEERLAYSDWYIGEVMQKMGDEQDRQQIEEMPAAEFATVRENMALGTPASPTAPQVSAAYAGGHCLWISGFSIADYADGTSLTWIGLDAFDQELAGIIRIPRRGARVRHVDAGAFYTTYRDRNGVHIVERYPLPSNIDC